MTDTQALRLQRARLLERMGLDRSPPWYTVEAPWRSGEHPTYAIAGQRDPHGAPAVLDTMAVENLIEWEDEDIGGRDSVDVADAALDLAVLAVNEMLPLIMAVEAMESERDDAREWLQEAADAIAAAVGYAPETPGEGVASLVDQRDEARAERDRLATRGDELRALIVDISKHAIGQEEAEEQRAQIAALVAEVGTLRSEVRALRSEPIVVGPLIVGADLEDDG